MEDTDIRNENIKRLTAFRNEIQFESQMLSGRLGAYLSSQSFLVIAYASTMNAGWTKPGIFVLLVSLPLALLGFVLSLDALRSIRTSYGVIQRWHDRQNALLEQHGDLADYWPTEHGKDEPPRDPTLSRRFHEGTLLAIHSPWIFGIAWIYLAGVAVWLYLR
ncbi:hypothetical protein GCM10011402_29710 [Paracoccus acridae]|uniref:Uncharacterized protein n=1 Tax=Paracoccus acridae TaxID=1795310 RepID=A0ABQ1VKM2_9RHOB|nr:MULTISPECIES: hypothetical protein [Paracoccus]QIR86832.1 hypothetical protein FIU66_16160 [Paracoccus sp. AK26]GGF75095.1 hypothetical protein GCM10011402_29710 [Paracoccus acridae]